MNELRCGDLVTIRLTGEEGYVVALHHTGKALTEVAVTIPHIEHVGQAKPLGSDQLAFRTIWVGVVGIIPPDRIVSESDVEVVTDVSKAVSATAQLVDEAKGELFRNDLSFLERRLRAVEKLNDALQLLRAMKELTLQS